MNDTSQSETDRDTEVPAAVPEAALTTAGWDADDETPEDPLGEAMIEIEKEEKRKKKKKKKKKKDKAPKDVAKKAKAGLGTSKGVETLFRTSYRVNTNLTSLADAKSNIMISINGIIISILLGSIASKIDTNPWLIIPTVIFLVGCLVSMVFAVLAARPRVPSKPITLDEVRKNKANLLFFGNFSRLTQDDFVEGMTDLISNTDLVYTNMTRDTYGLGLVLTKKYALLKKSYTIFMLSLVAGVGAFILIFALVASGVIETQPQFGAP
jgi:hypothetical protein